MPIRSLADLDEDPGGAVNRWHHHRHRSGPGTPGRHGDEGSGILTGHRRDLDLATHGDFLVATDTIRRHHTVSQAWPVLQMRRYLCARWMWSTASVVQVWGIQLEKVWRTYGELGDEVRSCSVEAIPAAWAR